MKVMVIVKASPESEAGQMPSAELLGSASQIVATHPLVIPWCSQCLARFPSRISGNPIRFIPSSNSTPSPITSVRIVNSGVIFYPVPSFLFLLFFFKALIRAFLSQN